MHRYDFLLREQLKKTRLREFLRQCRTVGTRTRNVDGLIEPADSSRLVNPTRMACGPTEIGVLAVVFRRMLADLHELLSRKFGYLQHSRLEYAAGWTRERSEMKAIDVEKAVGNLPYMSRDEADYLHSFFDDNGIRSCLELGFFHGVSSAYIAAKMAEVGGHLTTIDRIAAKQRQPNIDQLLEKLNLSEVVTVIYEPRSYTWALMKLLEGSTTEQFDFVFVDGGH